MESYVLGLATDAERLEFEQMVTAHAEIAEARDAFERSLETLLVQEAPAPPSFIKEKIQQQITPVVAESSVTEEMERTPVRRMNVWWMLAAACFVGLLAAGYWAYDSNEKYKALETRQSGTERELAQKSAQLDSLYAEANLMRGPDVKMVKMQGTPNAPKALTTVFWDSTNKDVYMFVNNLPAPATDKQYQLWALLDGKPIDLGMLELKQNRLLVRMKNVQNAQAFAVTLEPKGGSVSPTLTAMYVSGNL